MMKHEDAWCGSVLADERIWDERMKILVWIGRQPDKKLLDLVVEVG